MKEEKLKTYAPEVQEKFFERQITCPYQKGKIQLQKITRWWKEKIIAALDALQGKDFSSLTYDELLKQNNEEKSMEYQLSHDAIALRIEHAYAYYEPHIPTELTYDDLCKITQLTYDEAMNVLPEVVVGANVHIRKQFPEVYEQGTAYGILKKKLAKDWCRQAGQWKPDNAFEQLTDPLIMSQLVVQTMPYILYLTNQLEEGNTFPLKEAKAPQSRYFLANLWIHLMRLVRGKLPGGGYYPECPEGEFYDDTRVHWISAEAAVHLESIMKEISNESFNLRAYAKIRWWLPRNIAMPDEAIYGCPVKDSFTKFFRITVAALYHASRESK